MAKVKGEINSNQIKTKNQITVKDSRTGEVKGSIFTKNMQVGIPEYDCKNNPELNVYGKLKAFCGISGSIQQLTSGKSYLVAGTGVTITSASNGQITFNVGSISPANPLTLGNGFSPYNSTYNGTSNVSVAILAQSLGGLAASSSGVKLSPGNLTSTTSATTSWELIVSNGSTAYRQSISSILNLGLAGGITLTNPLTLNSAGGIRDTGGASQYNNSATVDLALKLESNKGLAVTSSGLKIDPSNISAATVATGDKVLIGDINDSDNIKTVTAQSIANLATVSNLANALTIGNGVQLNSGATFDGSTAKTLSVQANGSTISVAASGISVQKVPNALTNGNGISSLSFDGSSSASVTAQATSNKGVKVTASGIELDISNLPVSEPTISDTLVFYDVTLNQERKNTFLQFMNNIIQPAIDATKNSGTAHALTQGPGISSFSFNGSAAGQTVSIDQSTVPMLANNNTYTGKAIFSAGLSGSLTHINNGTSYLVAGSNVTITSGSNGQITIASSAGSEGGSIDVVSGSTTVNTVDKIDFSHLGVLQNLGNGDIALTGSIGIAEDGSYTDGLFTDFTSNTPIGTAVDRFNEVLKGLAPSAAPDLDDLGCDDSGVTAKLSFGSSQSISGYTNAQPSTLTPSSGLSNTDINGTYDTDTASNDLQRACFNGAVVINGVLNTDVVADGVNYAADSFGNADQGTLKLFVNDNSTPVHSVNLNSFGSGNSLTNGSGFNLTAKTPGHFADGSNFETFQHRQGTYTIAAGIGVSDPQRRGWNFARVVHTIGSTDKTCNYIEWINDDEATALSASGGALASLSMTGNKDLSGVKYNTGGTATYTVNVDNAYKNVYSTGNITFNGTNCGNQTQSFPTISVGSQTAAKQLNLSQVMTINASSILNGSISTSVTVPHPLKSDLSAAESKSISGILLYSYTDNASETSEDFRGESYRVKSGAYNNQSDVPTSDGATNDWDSTTDLTTVDGLLFYDRKLYRPNFGGVSGDFRNSSDGGSIANGPSSNRNYSGITSGTRTFYRRFRNNSGGSKSNFALTINGTGTIIDNTATLNGNKIKVFLKLPTNSDGFSTGWMDLALPFATGQTGDNAGCLNGSFDSSLNATNNATFGTQSAGDNDWIILKIQADATWTGNISNISVSWS